MLRVLTYHRIGDFHASPALNPRLISATPSAFARQMGYLAASFRVVSLPEVLSAIYTDTSLPKRAVLITFDDAYVDFGRTAWPILRHFGLPVTMFVPTAYPDHPDRAFWWDRLYRALMRSPARELASAQFGTLRLRTVRERLEVLHRITEQIKSVRHADGLALVDDVCARLGFHATPDESVLGWDELRALARAGVTICAHTRTHPLLTRIQTEEARAEIAGSQQDVRRHIGHAFPVFCYPDGQHNETHVAMLRQQGFRLAFTSTPGHNDLRADGTDRLRLCRTNITPRTSALLIRGRLTALGGRFDRWRQARRRGSRLGAAELVDASR